MNPIDETTLETALTARGWRQLDSARWRLESPVGDCRLVETVQRDRWRQFQLSGGRVTQADNDHALEENARVFGPAKFVPGPGDRAVCRVDVPDALVGVGGHVQDNGGQLQIIDAYAAWATAITACGVGNGKAAPNLTALDVVANYLKQVGWSASLVNDVLQIHLQLPGIYRQLTVEHHKHTGVKLATDLVRLEGLDDDCVCAMKHLGNAVNARVPLVRLTLAGPPRDRSLRAEVGFGRELIPGEFLRHALSAFETAIALCVRELEALCDLELARLVLNATDAHESTVSASN